MQDRSPSSEGADTRPRPGAVAAALGLAFVVPAGVLIASGRIPERVFSDQRVYHEEAIRQFAREWPAFNFTDYASATTPGYHVLLAGVVRFLSGSTLMLQAFSALFTLALVMLLGWWVGRATSPWRAIALALPFAASTYIVQSGVWLLPDNLAWFGVLAILVLALRPPESAGVAAGVLIRGGAVLAALVFTRQIHLWAAGLLWLSAWLTPPLPPGAWWRTLVSTPAKRIAWLLGAFLVTLPAFGVLAWFRSLWGGALTPPKFASLHQSGLNLAAPAFTLALVGGFSMLFGATLLAPLVSAWRERRGWLIGAGIAALALGVAAPTTYSMAQGRWTGLWNLAAKLPSIGHTSLLIAGLAVVGGVALVAWTYHLDARRRLVLLGALAGFAAAQSVNAQLWQRYVEPLVLMVVIYLAACAPADAPRSRAARWREAALPVLAALAFTALNLRALTSPLRVDSPVTGDVAPGQAPPPISGAAP